MAYASLNSGFYNWEPKLRGMNIWSVDLLLYMTGSKFFLKKIIILFAFRAICASFVGRCESCPPHEYTCMHLMGGGGGVCLSSCILPGKCNSLALPFWLVLVVASHHLTHVPFCFLLLFFWLEWYVLACFFLTPENRSYIKSCLVTYQKVFMRFLSTYWCNPCNVDFNSQLL